MTSQPGRRRGRFEAWLHDKTAEQVHAMHGRLKGEIIGAMTGTIVELGPGAGANMRYYGSGVHVIGIEPNPAMHDRLTANADRSGVDLEIRTLHGESIDVADGAADAVVATLVLCGVGDPNQVMAEVRRVLKPGGTFFFIEHVVAPSGSWTRRLQRLVKRPHRWLFNGCEVDRDTAELLRNSGFGDLDIRTSDAGVGGMYVRHQIMGTATR